MSFFSNAVRLIRRIKDSQNIGDTFDISDNLPKVSKDGSGDSSDSAGAKSNMTPTVSFGWISDLDDAPLKSDFHPVMRSDAYSTKINDKLVAAATAMSNKDQRRYMPPTSVSDFEKKKESSHSFADVAISKPTENKRDQNRTDVLDTVVADRAVTDKVVAEKAECRIKSDNTASLSETSIHLEDQNINQEKAQTEIQEPIQGKILPQSTAQINVQPKEIDTAENEISQDGDATNVEIGFSLRNYTKESFSVMIVRPISNCMHKVLRVSYFAITGVLVGGLVALITCLIALQFGSVENSVISAYLLDKVDTILPDSDISIKSAMLQWNSEASSVEICLNKVKFEDFFIPKVTVLPNYTESFKNWKFVADTIAVVEPKVTLHIADDFKTVFIDPNLLKTKHHKAVLEPVSSLTSIKDSFVGNGIIHSDATFKIINADVSVVENKQSWDAQNFFCEYKLGDSFPKIIDFRAVLPKQKYASSVRIARFSNDLGYDLKINSLNPAVLYEAFIKRNTPFEKFLPIIYGYNLPVSGDAKIFLNPDKSFKNGSFNFLASKGVIRIPNHNSLALNLGKKVDNCNISGTILDNKINFDSINISYGNSGVQLTGLSIPLNNFTLANRGNIDGTFSLTNTNVDEICGTLPENMSKPIISMFHNYVPGFRLDLLKFDLKGPISFTDNNTIEQDNGKLSISQGIFKLHGAKIPVNKELMVSDIDATGTIKNDGFEVKISSAKLGSNKINSGTFFISNDKSWIGKVNINLSGSDIQKYANFLNLGPLPINKIKVDGKGQLDLKLVRLAKDQFKEEELPFKIAETSGKIESESGNKKLSFAQNKEGYSVIASIIDGKHSSNLEITENSVQKTGATKLHCVGDSHFLGDVVPFISKGLGGEFDLTLNKTWDKAGEQADLSINLNNATLNLPVLGQVKARQESGKFSAHIQTYPDRIALSHMLLETPKTKINGHMTTDNNWNITECVLDDISTDGISARANIFKKDDKKLVLSIVGDSFNSHKLAELMNKADKDVRLMAYLNMKKLIFNGNTIENLKGTIDILGGHIVDGSCIGTLGDSTLVFNTKPLEDSNDYIVSISSSDAEKFLKTFGIGTSIDGGTITFSVKSSDIAKGVISGNFEMNNFLVKNNAQLMRLITLSSPNFLNGTHITVGFNTCSGHLELVDQKLIIENLRAISPTAAISLNGEYDRLNDELNASGIILPPLATNAMNPGGYSAANFSITGSFWNPSLSVSTPRIIEADTLQNIFGNTLPQIGGATTIIPEDINLEESEKIRAATEEEVDTVKIFRGTPETTVNTKTVSDPYANKSFDKDAALIEIEKKQKLRAAKNKTHVKNKLKEIKSNFGVKINRGKTKKTSRNRK